MQQRLWRTLAAFGLVFWLSGGIMNADDKKADDKKEESKKEDAKDKNEVALPKLPKGAGKVDKEAPKTLTETKSGLKYRVLRKGDDKKPKATSKVEVNYHGWLDNGKVFDSSYDRSESISFPLNGVIPGWTEGMQLVGKGGMIELEIPYKLGYGESGTQGIPPKATLHFLVELIDIK